MSKEPIPVWWIRDMDRLNEVPIIGCMYSVWDERSDSTVVIMHNPQPGNSNRAADVTLWQSWVPVHA